MAVRIFNITMRLGMVMLACSSVIYLFGCEAPVENSPGVIASQGNQTNPVATETVTQPAVVWQPLPKSMRVYPSTRFIQESGQPILEARFELFDEMGDSVKASGLFRIELYTVDEVREQTPKRLLYTWSGETYTLDQQRDHYDPITRGYLFRLGVGNLKIANQPTLLKVTFIQEGRPNLEAQAVIRADW